MPPSDAQKRASSKYQDKLDTLRFRVPRGEGEKIKDHAASRGESLNQFVIRAIQEAIEHDKGSLSEKN